MEDNTDFTDALLDTDSFLRGFDLSDDFRGDEKDILTPEPMQLDFYPKWHGNDSQQTKIESTNEKLEQIDMSKFEQLPDLNKILSQSGGCVSENEILLDQLNPSPRQEGATNGGGNFLRQNDSVNTGAVFLRDDGSMNRGTTLLRQNDSMNGGGSVFLKQDTSMNRGSALVRRNSSMNGDSVLPRQVISVNGGSALLRQDIPLNGGTALLRQGTSMNGGSALLRQNDSINEGAILLRPSVLESTMNVHPSANQERQPVLIPNNQFGQVLGNQMGIMNVIHPHQENPRHPPNKNMDFTSRFPKEAVNQQMPSSVAIPIQYVTTVATVQSPPSSDINGGRPFVIRSTNHQQNILQKDLMTFSFPTTLEPRQFIALSALGQDPQQDSSNPEMPTSQTYLIKPAHISPPGIWSKNEISILPDDQEPPSPSSTIREREPPSPTSTIRERRTSNCSLYNRVSTPSPVMSSSNSDQKYFAVNYSDGLPSPSWSGASPKNSPRPSPKPTPPPVEMHGRESRSGKRTRPQTPTSDNEYDKESLVLNAVELKPRLEELEDEEKYNKRKNPTGNGDGKRTDFNKSLLDQLQRLVPHIGDPEDEKVSQAGILCEGSDFMGSLKREINAISENVKAQQEKIEKLNAEIEAYQMQLPEHGSPSIHRIVSSRGKSIPDMFADHVRRRTQTDWRYWVFTSIMGHFIHSYSQEVSNISPSEMQTTSLLWVQERMSLQALRKDAYRKLAKLCSKTSIMEDPSKLPGEARSFVDLEDVENREREEAKLNEREMKLEAKSIL